MKIDNGQIYEIYKNRLLDLSGRNKLVSFRLTAKSFDLFSLFNFDVQSLLNGQQIHINQKTFVDTMINKNNKDVKDIEALKSEYITTFDSYLKKLGKLNKENDDDFRESGKHSLYLGCYYLSGKLYGDNVVKFYAPLFLMPMNIDLTRTSFKLKRADDDILINRTILIALMKTLKGKIDIPAYEIGAVNDTILLELIKKIENLGIVIQKDLQFSKFPTRTGDCISDKYELHNHMVLSNLNVSTALFDDYERIGGDTNNSIQNLLNENIILNRDCEFIQSEYSKINLTNRELSLISKLDTSQELAVYMAKQSNNLVIYGPPGTGKSETILNIISDYVARNKRVLVVSGKKAAINVLYNRLMELQMIAIMFDSSNKKISILKDEIASKLRDMQITPEKCDLATSLDKIEECYRHFDSIFELLNTQHKGRKLSEWYGEKKVEMAEAPIDVEWFESIIYRNAQLRELFNIDYADFCKILKKIDDTALIKTYKILTESDDALLFMKLLLHYNVAPKELMSELYIIKEKQSVFSKNLKTFEALNAEEKEILTKKDAAQQINAKKNLLNSIRLDLSNLNKLVTDKNALLQAYHKISNHVTNISSYDDLEDLVAWGETTNFEYDDDLIKTLNAFIAVSQQYYELNSNIFSKMLNKAKCSSLLEEIECHKNIFSQKYMALIKAIEQEIQNLTQQIAEKHASEQALTMELTECVQQIELLNNRIEQINQETAQIEKWVQEEFSLLPNICRIDPNGVNIIEIVDNIDVYIEATKTFRENRDFISELIVYNPALFGLYHVLQQYNLLEHSNASELLWKVYLEMQIENIGLLFDSELKSIRQYEQIQCEYLKYENIYFRNTRQAILTNTIDKRKDWNQTDEYLLKERNFKKSVAVKRKDEKLRQFMNAYFEVIQNYFPIILSTPDAVSKYLPLQKDMFDVVIFDEASQLVIENALPAIYRGTKIIVVGDDKQLQPSSFFKTNMELEDEIEFTSDESNEDENTELFAPDSIALRSLLDITKGKYNAVSLLFHYRSKFAELIDFSNAVFYKGQLKLAPNVQRDSLNNSITRILVNGEWSNRSNEVEAKEVVSLLKKIFKERTENETIGIVTFNIQQKVCIEDAIEREMVRDAAFKQAYSAEMTRIKDFEDESIFIKNIENVQGDERDIIIFSVGYGYDRRGKLATAFGPLSQDGGENRLNVAISRAKKKVYLITSFEPEELDVEGAKHEGARIFKDYLLYVKYVSQNDLVNRETLLNKYRATGIVKAQSFDSPFEEQVYHALTNMGYIVDTQVGCYGFRIDMAVYDENKGKYILGIECDGAAYHSSKNVKDRDIARQAFLESCGWKIHRIWSTSWWKEQAFTMEKLQKAINDAMNS